MPLRRRQIRAPDSRVSVKVSRVEQSGRDESERGQWENGAKGGRAQESEYGEWEVGKWMWRQAVDRRLSKGR